MDRRENRRATFVAALAVQPATRKPAAELTTDAARLLDTNGFRENTAAARTADTQTASRISDLVNTSLTVDEVAEGLGITAARVHQKRLAHELWAITDGQAWIFPAPQFDTTDADHPLHAIPGIGKVFKALPEDLHPLAVEGFLNTPHPDLSSDRPVTPREWLRHGGDIATLVTVASNAYRWQAR
ncbi:hypothetical protein DDJ48_01735 [Mycobacteroides abscessus]|uniref:DNA-binding protein n=1 Tax=Mycobacteroides abscessus TaxID=36809 RepID=UPI000D3E7912|nr:DNA-binding protein [Mycobacteroides abscessus]PVA44675.1 hypothetical protein DDJ48_01735 [Mycobacteroides abscessus]RIT93284.1 DNA-binding protein [Mycobacteroides abscessus]